jgi:pimeloyl-ACP methyl ester carboxylesterase
MLAGMYSGDASKIVAWNQALTSDMIFAQPVVYELDRISVTTLPMIGLKDTTAIGKDRAPGNVAKTLGNYPELARQARDRIRSAELVTFDDLGHAPQIQDPARFIDALLTGLARMH